MINKYLLGIALFVSATCYAGNCDYSWQSDSIGRNCGERSRYTDSIYQQQRELERQQRQQQRQWENQQNNYSYPSPYLHY